jgi:para-aminobenzoate synthetase component 1
MRPLIQEITTAHTPESLVGQLRIAECGLRNVVLLRTSQFDSPSARYSFVAANPFLTFRSLGSRCEIVSVGSQPSTLNPQLKFGDPWHLLDSLMSRFEILDEIDLPFPLGGCFGFWGYDLKNFTEPKLPRRAVNDLELPDCHVGFYDSLVVFDHQLGKVFIVSTGLDADGSRSEKRAQEQLEFWLGKLESGAPVSGTARTNSAIKHAVPEAGAPNSNISRTHFLAAVERAQRYIRAGDIYQVNLSQRLTVDFRGRAGSPLPADERTQTHERRARSDAPCLQTNSTGWELFQKLTAVSPAPFSAFLDCGDFQIVSSSPEQFLRMSGSQIVTRPIKGTRPRDAEPDARRAARLRTPDQPEGTRRIGDDYRPAPK